MNKKTAHPLPRRGGRPSRQQAEQLEAKILDAATALFFSEGYGAASIEEISRRAQISKRTFYARFENKAAVFSAVVHRIIQRLRPPADATDKLFQGSTAEEILRRIAPVILQASLSKQSLSLHRMILAEAVRFPELALIMNEQSSRQEAIRRIAAILGKEKCADPVFAAEQFLFMLTAAPQRRAMGMGTLMTANEMKEWTEKTVTLFLKGYKA